MIMGLKKTIVTDFEKPKKLAKAAHQAVCDQEAGHLKPLEEAESILKLKAMAWEEKAKKEAAEEQARLAAKAKAEEDEKRRALEARAAKAEAEAKLEREKKEKAEREMREAQEAQRKAEEAAKTAKNAAERARLEKVQAEAREQAEKSRREAAEAAEKEAKQNAKNEALTEKAAEVFVPVPVVQAETVEVKGQSMIDTYDIKVVDASIVPEQWKIVDVAGALAFVKATKGTRPIAGIEIIKGKRMSSRASK